MLGFATFICTHKLRAYNIFSINERYGLFPLNPTYVYMDNFIIGFRLIIAYIAWEFYYQGIGGW